MYVKLKVLIPHLKVNGLMELITKPELLRIISKIGLYSHTGRRVSIVNDPEHGIYWLHQIDLLGIPIRSPVTNDTLRQIWVKEYRYHEFIGNPLKIDYENMGERCNHSTHTKIGDNLVTDMVVSGLILLTTTLLIGNTAYKKFWK